MSKVLNWGSIQPNSRKRDVLLLSQKAQEDRAELCKGDELIYSSCLYVPTPRHLKQWSCRDQPAHRQTATSRQLHTAPSRVNPVAEPERVRCRSRAIQASKAGLDKDSLKPSTCPLQLASASHYYLCLLQLLLQSIGSKSKWPDGPYHMPSRPGHTATAQRKRQTAIPPPPPASAPRLPSREIWALTAFILLAVSGSLF